MDDLRYNKCLVVLVCFSALFPCFGEPLRYLSQKPGLALHAPYPDTSGKPGFVSLGNDGSLVLEFRDNVLLDGPGPDLIIFEINSQAEDVYVWISEDGIYYIPVGKTNRQKPSIDIGPYCRPGALYRYVKLRDDPSQGEKEGTAVGADIDA